MSVSANGIVVNDAELQNLQQTLTDYASGLDDENGRRIELSEEAIGHNRLSSTAVDCVADAQAEMDELVSVMEDGLVPFLKLVQTETTTVDDRLCVVITDR